MASALMLENSELKKRIHDIEEKNLELTQIIKNNMNGNTGGGGSDPQDLNEIMNLKHVLLFFIILLFDHFKLNIFYNNKLNQKNN